ncbi:TonB-dependent receptor [Rubrivivax gelatinosus]|uniref:TonB-dependent receptor n=1 Tax=Rubrivivax gelatinosus TaxID=28068 RepID=UPI0002D9F7C2|nr:TonB-dependent receptor [Rubrivivax gelatinosus]MBG6082906.1 TonB-dependent receptor [Rubrivivax gelatinosus]
MPQFPKRPRTPHTLIALAAAAAFPAFAQTTPVETIVITGQSLATDRALKDQAAADNVVSVVRDDGIGRLPDKNTAEALQRLPGISIERDQGEGRYVRIRGLGPDLNSVTFDGSLLPSPERDRRAVMLDVLPSALVRSLTVSKTLLPEQDANSIGGTVDVQTVSAFDRPGRFVAAELGASYETNTERSSPNGSLLWSDRFLDGKFGLAAGFSHEVRKFGSDNVETGGAWDGDALEEFQRRDYRITRERTGLALNAEYRPEAGTEFHARYLHSRFSDDEQRQAHVIEFDEAQEPGAVGEAESTRELKDRKETQTIRSLVLGTTQALGDWKLKAEAGSSRSREDTPLHIAKAKFEADEAFDGVGYSSRSRPRLVAPAAIDDASLYGLDKIEFEKSLVQDREHNLRLDLSRPFELAGVDGELKFGAKTSRRKKTSAQTTWVVDDFGSADTGLAAYASGSVDYPWGTFGPRIAAGPLNALGRSVNLADFVDDEESTVNDYRIDERVDAAYLQSTFDLGATHLIAGLRHERTRLDAAGTGVTDGVFEPIRARRDDRHWLPGLHLRHDLDARTTLRAAWSNSVVRPAFGQIAPGYVIDGDEASFGNPRLKPLRSANLDLGIERNLGYAGVASAYVFHKRIRDFSYQTDVAGTGAWADFDEAVTWANGDTARVSGVELAYSKALRELPAPWNGLVVGANATFSTSSAKIAGADGGTTVARDIPLPSQSKRVFNFVVGYEAADWSLRLAANYKSRYLLEVGNAADAGQDLYVKAQTQWDLSARYSLTKQLSLGLEALNLSDQPYEVTTGRTDRNAQYETYGRTVRINLKWAMQ